MSQGRVDGSIAIVTGASGGIAEAIARTLAREGAAVAVVSRDLARTQRVARDIEAGGGRMLAAVLDAFGRVDILVNGVGGFSGKASIEEITAAEWNEVLALNMTSAFLCARAVTASMKQQRSGRIINIGSQAGAPPHPPGGSFFSFRAA